MDFGTSAMAQSVLDAYQKRFSHTIVLLTSKEKVVVRLVPPIYRARIN